MIAHKFRITMMNVTDELDGVAVATAYVQDVVGEKLDIATVEAQASTDVSEVEVQFILRLSDDALDALKADESLTYVGEA